MGRGVDDVLVMWCGRVGVVWVKRMGEMCGREHHSIFCLMWAQVSSGCICLKERWFGEGGSESCEGDNN